MLGKEEEAADNSKWKRRNRSQVENDLCRIEWNV